MDVSQLLVNFSNKSYTPKDGHMAAYLEEVRKLEKHFKGMELMHIPRKENSEADDIAKRASRRQPQEAGVFAERLSKASIKQPQEISPQAQTKHSRHLQPPEHQIVAHPRRLEIGRASCRERV